MINKSKMSFSALFNSKILLFLIMSFVSIISFGVDLSAHQIYNLAQLALIENDLTIENGFYAFDRSPLNPLYYYYSLIVPILNYGALFLLLSFLVKFISFILVNRILANFLDDKLSVLLSIVFLMAYLPTSHGLVANGLWVSPAFFPASLSSLASLIGIYFFTKARYGFSGVFFGISIFLHSLYGISSLAFLLPGFFIILIKKADGLVFRNLIIWVFPVIFAISYIAFFRVTYSFDIDLTYSFYEWFKYTSIPSSRNISILWSINNMGYCLVPIFISGLYFALLEKKNTSLKILTISSIVMLFIFIFIEIVHLRGIFVNSLSELFIATQLRRGVWLVVLFSLAQIVKFLYEYNQEIFLSKLNILLLIFSIAVYIFPSPASIILLYSVLLIRIKNKFCWLLLLSSLFMIGVYYINFNFNFFTEFKALCYSIIFSVCTVIAMRLFGLYSNKIFRNFFISVIVIIALLFSSRGIYHKQIDTDLSVLISDSLVSKTDTLRLLDFLDGEVKFDYEAEVCMKQNSSDSSIQKIQLPITGIRNSRISLFSLDELHGYFNPMYSRKNFELSLKSLKVFFGSKVVDSFFENHEFFNKDIIREHFLDRYDNISIPQLKYLRDNFDLRFYLLKIERDELENSVICKGTKFFVYDLHLIN